MATQAGGESMTFQFYGSALQLVGAKRDNHANCQAQVDNAQPITTSGFASRPQFNQTLFTYNLDLAQHTFRLTNVDAGKFLDVDYVAVRTSVGQPDERLIVNNFDASHPSFAFAPPTSWTIPSALSGTLFGSNGRATIDSAASAQFTFQGMLWHFTVPLDPAAATATRYRPSQLMFYAGNLGQGSHTVRVAPGTGCGILAIDSAVVYTAPSLGGSFSAVDSASVHRELPTSVAAGLALACTIAVLATFCSLYLLWRYRVQWRTGGIDEKDGEQASVHPFASPVTDTSTGRPYSVHSESELTHQQSWSVSSHGSTIMLRPPQMLEPNRQRDTKTGVQEAVQQRDFPPPPAYQPGSARYGQSF
ncbi:unnamed protein product [Cyclocybe aegerita]|uniref:Transmembrane protein n=1 Tax=Cyclocybe aegerita TaxID=1973307 RepID=A0A8S0VXD9_CYCAE|nr:unnamed protein product [Cyclocybe aegerita]